MGSVWGSVWVGGGKGYCEVCICVYVCVGVYTGVWVCEMDCLGSPG